MAAILAARPKGFIPRHSTAGDFIFYFFNSTPVLFRMRVGIRSKHTRCHLGYAVVFISPSLISKYNPRVRPKLSGKYISLATAGRWW